MPYVIRNVQNWWAMKKVGLSLILIAVVVFALGVIAEAQQHSKVPKIGWLVTVSGSTPGMEAFRREILALGYVESKNIAFESRYAGTQLDRLPALADELIRLRVDVLVTPSTPAALAAKNATKTIPIVFVISADPIAAGLVD